MEQAIELAEPVTAVPIAPPPAAQLPSNMQANPAALLELAVKQGADLDKLERLMTLHDRWVESNARNAFNDAMAAFKAEAIEIVKRRLVDYTTDRGRTHYKHAEIADVIEAIGPALSKHGFSWNWATKQTPTWIDVTCTLKHRLGHFETATLGGPPDTSGGKNAIQAIGSTTTYLERYTLKAVTGVAEKGDDDDGSGGAPPALQEGAKREANREHLKLQSGRDAAEKGMVALTSWWRELNAKERSELNSAFTGLRKTARLADGGGHA